MNDYGRSFNVKYPDIEFEVVSTGELFNSIGPNDDYGTKLIEYVKNKNLDVVMLNQADYELLAGGGMAKINGKSSGTVTTRTQ